MRSTSIIRGLLFTIALTLSICVGAAAIQANAAYPFYWETMNVDLQLVESGDLLVTETQKYIFTDPYTTQRSRYIQIDKIDKIQDIQVTENDRPVSNLQVSTADGKQYIRWEHTLASRFPGVHTFILKYRVIGGLEVANAQTKFKWMAIFPDRQALIKSAQVNLHLPAQLSKFAKKFTSNGVATTTKYLDSTTIQFTSAGSIEPQSQLAILGEFSTDALKLNKSQWQSSLDNSMFWTYSPIIGLVFHVTISVIRSYLDTKFYPIVGRIFTIVALLSLIFLIGPLWVGLLFYLSRIFNSKNYSFRVGFHSGGDGGDGGDGGGCGGGE